MIWTTIGFFAMTASCIMIYLRRTSAAAPSPKQADGPACPRCGAAMHAGSKFCSGCGVPQQIYEIVSAATAPEGKSEAGPRERSHAVVRTDMCVGCGTCVASCPEDGAVRLEHKLAVIDLSRCVGHGSCASACPVGAIFMTTGGASQRIEVPLLTPDFQSNVPGIYLVGEIGGRGLIKNAINEGKIAIEAIARALPPGIPRMDEDPQTYDVIIVGSGPAGLSAGLEALRLGLKYLIVEQGTVADTVRKYPRHKILLAEPVQIPLYGDLWIADSSKETLLQVWETIIANTGLEILSGCAVENVVREGSIFRVETPDRSLRARKVVLAMGRRGTPRRLGVTGEDSAKVFYDIVEMEVFRGQRALVVGGGDSAVESALGLANQDGTKVTLSYRRTAFDRIKERNLSKLQAASAAGKIDVLLESTVTAIHPDRVELLVAGKPLALPNDVIFIRIGGEPPNRFLERIGIRMVKKDILAEESIQAEVA